MSVELLSPAGSLSALKVAINAGADAVYIGGEKFSARKSAKNFTLQEIKEAVEYAHKYNRKIYLALNTLLYNDEIAEIIEYLYEVYQLGIDALIIQDFSLFQLVKKALPDFELHASTQMAVMNTSGAKLLNTLGFQRVVLARETSIEEMKVIKNESKIECEVFIHGALCISYSGLCYMSSLIGGRSGNRGDCAQPCRQKYHLIDSSGKKIIEIGSHLLSPKDLALAEILPKIIDAKMDSLKIEGRLKQDDYVYLVTNSYRTLINNYKNRCYNKESSKLIEKLEQMYSRSGFTQGFSIENPYNDMMSYKVPKKNGIPLGDIIEDQNSKLKVYLSNDLEIGDGIVCYDDNYNIIASGFIEKLSNSANRTIDYGSKNSDVYIHLSNRLKQEKITKIFLTFDKSLSKEIKEISQIRPEETKVGIRFYLSAKLNEVISLIGITNDNEVHEVYSDYEVQLAKNIATTNDEIKEKLNRLGNSKFILEECHVSLDPQIFIPSSVINHLRQELLFKFNKAKNKDVSKDHYLQVVYDYLDTIPPSVNLNSKPKLVIKTASIESSLIFSKLNVAKIIFNLSYQTYSDETIEKISYLFFLCKEKNIELAYTASPILNSRELETLEDLLAKLIEKNSLICFYISNISQLEVCQRLKIDKIYGTEHLNVTNDLAIDFYMKQGVEGLILSQEISLNRLPRLSMIGNISTELIVHGHSIAMFLQHDIIKSIENEYNIKLNNYTNLFLVNSHKDKYRVIVDNNGKTSLINEAIIHVLDSFEYLKSLGIDSFILDFQYDCINLNKASDIVGIYIDLLDNKVSVNESKNKLRKLYNEDLVSSYYIQQ